MLRQLNSQKSGFYTEQPRAGEVEVLKEEAKEGSYIGERGDPLASGRAARLQPKEAKLPGVLVS